MTVKSSFLLGALALAGCSVQNPEHELFFNSLQEKVGVLRVHEELLVEVPRLQPNEQIILVNGQYFGKVCSGAGVGKELERQIHEYSGRTTAPAFVLFAREGEVVDSFALQYGITSNKGLRDVDGCAVVVGMSGRALAFKCLESWPAGENVIGCSVASLEIRMEGE